jgi:thymidine kinase
MSKLYFRYGAMGASKTANAIMVAYNYGERGQKAVIIKPAVDTRDEADVIRSRIGLQAPVVKFHSGDNLVSMFVDGRKRGSVNCIVVDEAQFLTDRQVHQLAELADVYGIPVICYGLRTDFRGELFPGSKALMAYADSIEEIKTMCWCGKKATFNARIVEGRVVREGEQVIIGGNEMYVALCRMHWTLGMLEHQQKG